MITDKIEYIDLYKEIPKNVYDFIQKLDKNIKVGKYNLSDSNYANVEIYKTKLLENASYEAHEKYIDIQILLSGEERIYYTDRNKLDIEIPYNESKDIVFYKNEVKGDFATLNGSNFVMLFPHEAHAPQVFINKESEVKKVVVKIKIS